MTLCLGLATSRGVWIGSDSGTTSDNATEVCSAPKIWRSNGWLVASAGVWRALEIMRYDVEFPPPGNSPHRALCMDLQTRISQAFQRNDWEITKNSDGDVTTENAYYVLAAYGDSLFQFDFTGHVERVKRGAIGGGNAAEYALGLLDASEIGSAERRIKKALTQTAKRYRFLVGPYPVERA